MTEGQHAAQGNAGEIERVGGDHLGSTHGLGGEICQLDTKLQVVETAYIEAGGVQGILTDRIRVLTVFQGQFDLLRVAIAGDMGIGDLFANAVVLAGFGGDTGTGFDFAAIDLDYQAHCLLSLFIKVSQVVEITDWAAGLVLFEAEDAIHCADRALFVALDRPLFDGLSSFQLGDGFHRLFKLLFKHGV